MYELGWAHSVEVWSRRGDGLVLVGGLFGLQIGGLFAAESKFHRVRDASKAAVVALCRHLSGLPGGESRLVDTQWQTPHLGTLGVCEVDRRDYLAALPRIVGLPPSW
jgi:leucyl/phenylalanyl-tRNA--protein transferase